MTMRAIVERNAAVARDAYGGPVAPDWQEHATLPCLAHSVSKERHEDGQKGALQQSYRCAFQRDADLTEADRVAEIQDRLGAVIFAGPLKILVLQRRRRHLEAKLERVH